MGALPYDCEHMTRELEEIDFETLSHDCLIEHLAPSGYCTIYNGVVYPTMIIVFLVPNLDECRFFRSSLVSGQRSSTFPSTRPARIK